MATTAANPGPALSAELLSVRTGDRVFVDTNVLAYEATPTAPLHAIAHAALSHLLVAGAEIWVSRQVLREFVATLTRPQSYAPATPAAVVVANVSRLETQLRVAEDGPLVFARLLALLGSVPCGGKQVHDANIVATMLAHGVPTLLTHNVKDFQRFAGHVAVAPLVP